MTLTPNIRVCIFTYQNKMITMSSAETVNNNIMNHSWKHIYYLVLVLSYLGVFVTLILITSYRWLMVVALVEKKVLPSCFIVEQLYACVSAPKYTQEIELGLYNTDILYLKSLSDIQIRLICS
jgi:hypothetical protein